MEALLPDTVKAILLGLIVVAFGLVWLARVHPRTRWLQVFRLPAVPMSEEERARGRRAANRLSALEFVGAGLLLPILYVLSTVMMFNDFKTIPTIIVAACSILCIAFGTWIYVRNR